MSNRGRLGPNAEVASKIDQLQQKLTKIERMAAGLGRGRDDTELRRQLDREMKNVSELSKTIMNFFRNNNTGGSRGEQQVKQREQERFAGLLNRYKEVSQKVSSNDRSILAASETHHTEKDGLRNGNVATYGGPTHSVGQQQGQITVQQSGVDIQFLQFKEEEVNQRHEGILQIERDTLELLDMFQDLDTLTKQQQANIDIIATNVEVAKDKVIDANVQLDKAEQSQIAAKNKKCCFVGMLVTAALVIAIVVYVIS
jgi:syntaxin 7